MYIKGGKLVPVFVCVVSLLVVFISNKTFEELLEINTCPVCFGDSLCSNFSRNEITSKNYVFVLKLITYISNVLEINNVIHASSQGRDIVVKKLEHQWESMEIKEKMTAENISSVYAVRDIVTQVKKYLHVPYGINVVKNIRLCPTVDKFDLLYKALNIMEDDIDALISLWFTITANPEPIIMKILCEENGWPVPKYVGSCGRAAVFEYSGDMLSDRIHDTWNSRANIARQLLRAAFNFTFSHPDFAFYLTDVTPDNIAVSSEGKVRFIDLDHIIIVDKHGTANTSASWNVTHSSEDIECDNCFAFNTDDLCDHKISDHNVYAVCREILNPHSYLIDGGLMHSPSELFLKTNPQFWAVLLHCVQPVEGKNRFYYAKQLLDILI